jgi:hypothetical protein
MDATLELVMQPSAVALLHQMLAWIAERPRCYGETMDAWRTSCPRMSVWEDASEAGFVRVEAAGAASQAELRVRLTDAGAALLAAAGRAAEDAERRAIRMV